MSFQEMLTPQNSAIAMIDYQAAMYQGVQSHDRLVTFHNIQILAKSAKLFKIPTVISTVENASFAGPFQPEVTELFPEHKVIDRTSMNSWLDANFRKAIHDTGRKKVVLAGLWTEACVMFPTLDMLREGFEIYIAADACADISLEAHNRSMDRAVQAGAIDAGGGFQNYPEDYAVIQKLHDENQLTIRLAYNLFTQKPKGEKDDFLNWTKTSKYKQGDDYFRHNGAGEMLVFSAADFEDFRQPRPDMEPEMEGELEDVVRILVQNRWPWRLHATYDETISRALDVFERVNQEMPLEGLNWFFDHAETISDQSIDRIAALGGGIAVQHRMAYQGEYFVERYGHGAAEATPPVKKMLDKGVKVSAGTDATRVASYNPWVSLSWLVTGRTVGGVQLYPQRNCLDRETALRMWTENVTWFSNEEGKKGRIQAGQLADLVVPDRDFFACPENEIAEISSMLTIVGGRVVYGVGDFKRFDDHAPPPAMPDWSPVRTFGGYGAWAEPGATTQAVAQKMAMSCGCANSCGVHGHDHATAWSSKLPISDLKGFWGALGCACWAV